MVSSLAPAQVMMTIATRNRGWRSRSRTRMPPDSAPDSAAKGAVEISTMLAMGIAIQSRGSTRQAASPRAKSSSVEIRTVATCPQQ